MSRRSEIFLPTLRDSPAGSPSPSLGLLARAGLVRQLGRDAWMQLPGGFRVEHRVESMLREEMKSIGSHEMLMPAMPPASAFVAAIGQVGKEIRSHRDLPVALFQLQSRRSEDQGPRGEAVGEDLPRWLTAYSFDLDDEGLERSCEAHTKAFERVLDRCEVTSHRCRVDDGGRGRPAVEALMAPTADGLRQIAVGPGYAALAEIASAAAREVELPAGLPGPAEVATPDLTTVGGVAAHLGLPAGALLKALPVIADGRGMVMVLLRGDHQLNEGKLARVLGVEFRQATREEIEAEVGPPGFIGPVGAEVPIIKDAAIGPGSYVAGSNRPGTHLRGVEPGRDFQFEEADLRQVSAGDPAAGGGELALLAATELGTVATIGAPSGDGPRVTYQNSTGHERPVTVGSYGIAPWAIVTAAVAQRADDRGIGWPPALAPWQFQLTSLARRGETARDVADRIYAQLEAAGAEVLYDDREVGAGQKLNDAELIGCPWQLIIGRRGLERGIVEAGRWGSETRVELPVDEAVTRVLAASRSTSP